MKEQEGKIQESNLGSQDHKAYKKWDCPLQYIFSTALHMTFMELKSHQEEELASPDSHVLSPAVCL